MKYFITSLLALLFLFSCNDGNGDKGTYRQKSVGNINVLQIVVENELWNGTVGEEIRNQFAAPTDGLPQDEPLFSMRQMPPAAFTGFARASRLFVHVSIGSTNKVNIATNEYAKPQTGAIVVGTSEAEIVNLLKEKGSLIIEKFHETEIKERQRRSRVQLLKMDSLPSDLGVTMQLPSAYRFAKKSEDFYWLRKDLKSGSTNVIVYEVPMAMIRKDSAVADIIRVRDSIGSKLMPVEEEGIFMTEGAYAPYIFKTEIDGNFTLETKGIWEVKDQYMAGPFINYAVEDTANNRWLIIEGFVYAPSVDKRDLQFELESIIRSAKLK